MRHPLRWFGWLAIFVVVIVSCEFLAFLATLLLIRQNLTFCPLRITESYESYQKRFLPNLGWPSQDFFERRKGSFDISQSRFIPAFPDPNRTPARVSLYGDSFTEAWGVDHEHAWGNVLSRLLNCRVSNFAVGGYGTDQAYLRFLQNPQDPAEVVVLGFFSENIKRNVNQFRNLISPFHECQTKPRFILNDRGQLTLVPIPLLTEPEYYEIRQNPGRFFHHEFFLPDGPSGRQIAKFPYLYGMIKAAFFLLKNQGRGDTYESFFQPGHPAQGLEVTTTIIKEFFRSAHDRGKKPLVLIIPTNHDLQAYQVRKSWTYQPLLDRLAEERLEYIDPGPRIIQHLNGDDPGTLYPPKLSYHLNEAGNRLLAQILHEFLTTRNILNGIQ